MLIRRGGASHTFGTSQTSFIASVNVNTIHNDLEQGTEYEAVEDGIYFDILKLKINREPCEKDTLHPEIHMCKWMLRYNCMDT